MGDSEVEALQLGAEHVVLKQFPSGSWRIANLLTCEVVELGDENWELGFNDNGDGYITNSAGASQWLADDLFRIVVFEQGGGDTPRVYFVRAGAEEPPVRLDKWYNSHIICAAGLDFDAGSTRQITFATFKAPADCISVRLSAQSPYVVGEFGMMGGVFNKWCHHGIPRWEALLCRLGVTGAHILRSAARDDGSDPVDDVELVPGPRRILDFVSFSCTAALIIVARMGCSNIRRGGCAQLPDRRRALRLLRGLVARLGALRLPTSLEAHIFVEGYHWVQPFSPEMCGSSRVVLRFTDGLMHRRALESYVASLADHAGHDAVAGFSVGHIKIPEDEPMDIASFLVSLAEGGASSDALFGQLCVFLGMRLQSLLMRELASDGAPLDHLGDAQHLAATPASLDSMTDRFKSKFLTRYMQASVKHCAQQQYLSMTLDIGTVARKPQVLCFLATPDNTAIIAPPQARRVSDFGATQLIPSPQRPRPQPFRAPESAYPGAPTVSQLGTPVLGMGTCFLSQMRKHGIPKKNGARRASPFGFLFEPPSGAMLV